jgi:uncharacterized protein YjiS (DUF1127 family)
MFRSAAVSVNVIDLFELPGRLLETLLLWQERARQRHDLAGLDGRALRDIGISRERALAEVRKPFWSA